MKEGETDVCNREGARVKERALGAGKAKLNKFRQ